MVSHGRGSVTVESFTNTFWNPDIRKSVCLDIRPQYSERNRFIGPCSRDDKKEEGDILNQYFTRHLTYDIQNFNV